MNTTNNLGLSKPIDTDDADIKPLSDNFQAIDDALGDTLTNLKTTAKSLIPALNEHHEQIGSLSKVIVSIDQYGAKPNDQTVDNGSIIQNALNDISAKYDGGTVIVPPGIYYVKTTWTMPSNTSLIGLSKGSKIKVADNAGGFYSLIYIQNVQNVSIEGLMIDMNPAGNQVDIGGGNGQSRYQVIYVAGTDSAAFTQNIKISNNIITSCGTWCVSVQGQYCQDVWILYNNLTFVYGYSTTAPYYDNTMLYFDCLHHFVIGNKIYTNNYTDDKAATAIETHYGRSIVQHNVVRGFATGIIITGNSYSGGGIDTDQNVSNNHFVEVRTGITLWPNASLPVQNVLIENNNIYLNQNTRNSTQGSFGINCKKWTTNNNQYSINNVKISNNSIRFESDTRTFTSADYVYNFIGIALIPYNNINNVTIENNKVYNSPAIGIATGSISYGSYTNYAVGCYVGGNTIINAGMNTNIPSAWNESRCGLHLIGNLKECIIGRNNLIDTNETTRSYWARPLHIQVSSITNCRVNKQNISCAQMSIYGFDFARSTDGQTYEGEGNKTLIINDTATNKFQLIQNDIVINGANIKRVSSVTQATTGSASGITVNGTSGQRILTFNDVSKLSLYDTFTIDVDSRQYTVLGIDGNTVHINPGLNTDKVNLGITFSPATYTNIV